MHRIARFLLALALLPTLASLAEAQEQPPCTYDTCALRMEASWLGPRLVRGVEGERVADVGLFGTRGLSTLVAESEQAREHALMYERHARPAAWLGLAGGLLLVIPVVYEDRLSSGVALSASVSGAALSLYSTYFQIRSQRAFSRALWWYNRELPR